MARRVIARFVGTNREFKKYLETLRASEVVSLDRQKKKPAPRRTQRTGSDANGIQRDYQ